MSRLVGAGQHLRPRGTQLWTPGDAGSPFVDPSSLPNLVAWYDFSTLGLANNAAIASVNDLSGNAHTITQVTGALQPLYQTAGINAKGAAKFTGGASGTYLSSAQFANAGAVSAFVVFQVTTAVQFAEFLTHQNSSWTAPYASFAVRIASGAGSYEAFIDDGSVSPGNYVSGGSVATGAPHQLALTYDQATEALFLDGALLQSKAHAGALTARPTHFLTVGGQAANGVECLTGLIGEAIVYGDGKNTADRQKVESYLRTKWGTP